jgi:hypothetical protein
MEINNFGDPIQGAVKKLFGLDYLFPYQRLVVGNIIEVAQAALRVAAGGFAGQTCTFDKFPCRTSVAACGAAPMPAQTFQKQRNAMRYFSARMRKTKNMS